MTRQWTGFGAPQDKTAALVKWIHLTSYREDLPLSLKARAHSSLARGFFDMACDKNFKILDVDRLYDVGNSANEAVALGLISPVTLKVAMTIESAGFREHSTGKFERLTDLWGALNARRAEKAGEDLKREVKVSNDPLSYFCAAEDCGIVATKKSTLWRCGGGCPQAFKPSYCSKDCQKAVRSVPYSPNRVAYSPCRTGSTINHSVVRMPQNRVFSRPVLRIRPPLSGGQTPRRKRAPEGPNQARSGPST